MKKYLLLQLIALFVCFLFLNNSFAQFPDTPQWHLPEGVKARIGKGRAKDIALSPDGTQLAVATVSGVWLYNARTGTDITLLTGHERGVDFVAYSPDGKTLASASSDRIVLWDPHTQRQKKNFGSTFIPESIVYSPGSQTLAVGHWKGVDLFNAQTGERKLSLHTGDYVDRLAFSPDGNTLATANSHIPRGFGSIPYLRHSPSGDRDKTIRLWDARNGRLLRTLTGHEDRVTTITFSPDGKTLASGGLDRTLRFWDVKTGRLQQTFNSARITSAAYSQDGKTLIVTTGGDVNLWNVRTGQLQIMSIGKGNEVVTSTAFSSNSRAIAIYTAGGQLGVWDTQTGENWTAALTSHFDFRRFALSPNGNTLAIATPDKIYSFDTLSRQINWIFDQKGSRAMTYSPDGNTLVILELAYDRQTDSPVSQIHLLNSHGQRLRTFGVPGVRFRNLVFSPDGKTLAIGSEEGSIHLWDVRNGRPLRTLMGHEAYVTTLAFSPDGRTLASRDRNEIRFWDVKTGRLQRTLDGSGYSIAYSPDGKTLASGDWGKVHFWDAKTGQIQQTLDSSGHPIVAYSPDGKTLASEDFDGLHFWDAKTGQLQQTFHYSGYLSSIAYSPDGNRLISLEQHGEILIWDTDVLQPIQDTAPQQPGKVVNMPDPKLAAAVRKALGLAPNATITKQKMRKLTELKAPNSEIKDLTGLEHATQLTRLDLQENQISDLSPLAGLMKLWRLELWGNRISDLSPLVGLTNLTGLFLSSNQIEDITPIAGLKKLHGLGLGYNTPKIRNIASLSGLAKLEWLRLTGNQIRDVSPLSGLVNLEVLKLKGNPIKDFSPLANLPNLRETDSDIPDPPNVSKGVIPDANLAAAVRKALDLEANVPITKQAMQRLTKINAREKNIRNLTGLEHATQLQTLNLADNQISDLRPLAKLKQLRGISLFRNQISDLRPLANLTQLTWLDFGGNQIKDITPLKRLVQLDWLSLWSNQISNLRSLIGLKRLSKLDLKNNKINNVTPLAKLTQLKELRLQDNQISKVIPLAKLVNLEILYLKENPIQNTSPLRNLPKLKEVDIEIPGRANAAPAITAVPDQTLLLANYPNPFNPETWIPYQLAKPSAVKITIYDTSGVVVRQLALGHQTAGTYTSQSRAAYWDGRNDLGERVASGIYFYQFQTDNISSLRKMLILK